MLHIKDKTLFKLKYLSFEYIQLRIKYNSHQDILNQYHSQAYSYKVLSCVADIDECFESIEENYNQHNKNSLGLLLEMQDLLDRCYRFVAEAINYVDLTWDDIGYQQQIKQNLAKFEPRVLAAIEHLDTLCSHHHKQPTNINLQIEGLHQAVTALQHSLQNVYLMALSPRH